MIISMGNKLIRFKDKVGTSELRHGGLVGRVIFGTGKHLVEYTDPFGNKSYRTEFDKELYSDTNIVPIGGYQFAFDKLFNIGLDRETTLRVGDLNDEAPQMKIGVPRSNYISDKYNAETSVTDSVINKSGINISAMNFIFGFMMGDGGARENNSTVIAPNYKSRGLFRAVPFRMSNDGDPIPAGKYYGKTTTSDGSTSYYVKKFDDPAPHIVHVWASDNPKDVQIVDDAVFSSTSTTAIESYVEMNLSIDEYDGRGFFTSTGASARVNEIGLVHGWYNAQYDDYESLRLFTHFTRPSILLTEGDQVNAVYRLYAR